MRRAAYLSLLAGVFLLAVVLSACGGAGANPTQIINGSGASFPAPFYGAAFREWVEYSGIQVNYQPIGSSEGLEQFARRTVDFGSTGLPMTEEEEREAGGNPLHIAIVGGAVVPSYNLEGVNRLNLTGEVLAGIFLGDITNWNDPALAELNPGTDLSDAEITVVHRNNGSGTTNTFTSYLAAVSPKWRRGPGVGDTVEWPVGVEASGNEGVADTIRRTPNSIGYLGYRTATESGLDSASIGQDGEFVEPSVESARAAIEATEIPEDLKVVISSANPQGEGVYPMASLSWMLVRQQMDDLVSCRAVAETAWYLTHDAQSLASDLGYARMPENVISINEELIRSMEAQGQPCFEG